MGKSMYNFGKNTKEKARQPKQMEKAAKRLAAKQNKANIELTSSGQGSDTMESSQLKEVI
ncbi:MAG: hypothetical protein STSR0003_11000 [Smithella sp.]|jgi:hypothetical protein|nr:hypothetical protein [Syntrophaceae bacterium]